MGESDKNRKVGIIKEVSNSNLNQDTQEELINKVIAQEPEKEEDAIMDKVFGKRNPQMYVTLFMSVIVLLIVVVLTLVFRTDMEFVKFLWNIAIPAMTLLWGYAFGKSQK